MILTKNSPPFIIQMNTAELGGFFCLFVCLLLFFCPKKVSVIILHPTIILIRPTYKLKTYRPTHKSDLFGVHKDLKDHIFIFFSVYAVFLLVKCNPVLQDESSLFERKKNGHDMNLYPVENER